MTIPLSEFEALLETPEEACPYNCHVGICTKEGCSCPLKDPETNLKFLTPPAEDCSAYGMKAFGDAFPVFRYGWVIILLSTFLFLVALNFYDLKETHSQYSNRPTPWTIRGFLKWLIPFAPLIKSSYFILDPYGLENQWMLPIIRRLLYSLSYLIILVAHSMILFYWIRVYHLNSGNFSGTRRHANLGNALLIGFLGIIISFWTGAAIVGTDQSYFIIIFGFCGLCVLLSLPFCVHYGHKLGTLVRSKEECKILLSSHPHPTTRESFVPLNRQIQLLTYGPVIFLILFFVMICVVKTFMRHNPDLFLIGESMLLGTEVLIDVIFAKILFGKRACDGGLIQWTEE